MSAENIEREYHLGEEAIAECLNAKRIGFKEISSETVDTVLERAPQGEVFTVPDKRYVETYTIHAKILGREDLEFKVEEAS